MDIRTAHLAVPLAAIVSLAIAAPVEARTAVGTGGGGRELSAVLQCVPYARDVTGIQIYGDAHTWWRQAKDRFQRGHTPRVGAVMAIRPHGNSRLGHVAAVSKVLDSRTVLLRHANWSSPGQIEDDVKAVDVSQRGDWSKVRIWHGPSQSLGTSHWPLYGFIYPANAGAGRMAAQQRQRRSSAVKSQGKPQRKDFIADVIAGRI